ncbi:MAG: Stp1/IreP family PP2C-type Ser/Thr phosphatase [Nitriliruptorales bacterium]
MRRLDVAAVTDQGRVRKRNEDALYGGDAVFAVADGMGGHLAGDVASATALLPVEALDGRVFPDAARTREALLDAILAANSAVASKAAAQPDLHGMGTTLTAIILEGRRLHVGHVGDSRAYLVRDGALTQLTRDHTLVAQLVEEGQLTSEQAAYHPQRSIITRAIGVDPELHVDTLTIDLLDGDQVLLCSDGLTGPVSDEEILDVLTRAADADDAANKLVATANARGGPDNITVVLVRFMADDVGASPDGASPATLIRPDRDGVDTGEHWAATIRRLGVFGRPQHGGEEEERKPTGRWQRAVATVAVLAALGTAAWFGGRGLLSRSYFVGIEGDDVAIYHGVPASVGPVELFWVAERSTVTVDDIQDWYVEERLRDGVAAADLADARQIIRSAPRDTPEPDEGEAGTE